jgi:hypothetical protein
VLFFFFKKNQWTKKAFAEIPLSIISTEFMSTISLLENYIQEIKTLGQKKTKKETDQIVRGTD